MCTNDSLFRYCYLNCSKASKEGSEPTPSSPPRTPPKLEPKMTKVDDKEVYIVHEYSWRNFFTTINFLKVLQKMTKHRSHRTFMLSQYKASVCHACDALIRLNTAIVEAGATGWASYDAVAGFEAHQESNATLWTKVETK